MFSTLRGVFRESLRRWLSVSLGIVLIGLRTMAAEPFAPTALTNAALHNLFQVAPRVFSGSSPDDEAGFAALARLGVRTVISVDGSRPDLAAAHRHGLRYVHLPIGYDGVPASRIAELAKAALTAGGAVYVHCHHGRHRGPAAAAVICQATAGWSTNQAVAWLTSAGTAVDYPGLYRSVREFRPPDPGDLARLPAQFPEVAPTPPLVEAMVAADGHLERLKAAQAVGWREVPHHPDITPSVEATLLWEQLRELGRTPETLKRDAEFRALLTASERATDQLRSLLAKAEAGPAERTAAFQRVNQSCSDCHRKFRN